VTLGFIVDIHKRIHYHFSKFFWLLASGPPTVASVPSSAMCPPGSSL